MRLIVHRRAVTAGLFRWFRGGRRSFRLCRFFRPLWELRLSRFIGGVFRRTAGPTQSLSQEVGKPRCGASIDRLRSPLSGRSGNGKLRRPHCLRHGAGPGS
jgi:hypothetical protein